MVKNPASSGTARQIRPIDSLIQDCTSGASVHKAAWSPSTTPFNSGWDDDIFQVNYMTFSDRHFTLSYPDWLTVIEPGLRVEYRRAIAEDPMVFVRNVFEKTRLAHRYLTDDGIFKIFPFDLMYRFTESHRSIYRATLLGLTLLAGIALLPPWRWLWGAIFPMIAVVAATKVQRQQRQAVGDGGIGHVLQRITGGAVQPRARCRTWPIPSGRRR